VPISSIGIFATADGVDHAEALGVVASRAAAVFTLGDQVSRRQNTTTAVRPVMVGVAAAALAVVAVAPAQTGTSCTSDTVQSLPGDHVRALLLEDRRY
jgi:hypothetical protein